ncbi:phosphodiesterase [Acetomicrobium sp. S15 = DSM 107314]|uniref:phosphodiesterase n=1 Tax=Acetomicrobium sp. S15 = DSM 107314 TaxID=2529858 RepID=UPI0018E1C36B|nr:phosphodiesterase [Acetomicrobium sp. S15 = DSM 107314]
MKGRVAIIADTHGSITAWEGACAVWGAVDAIFHVGDVLYHGPRNPMPDGYDPKVLAEEINASTTPVFLVRGNCDAPIDEVLLKWPVSAPLLVSWWNGRLLLFSHGEDPEAFREKAILCGATVAVSGHTHLASIKRERNVIFLNPGSASLPKGELPPSVALLDDEGIAIFSLSDGSRLLYEPWR